jgi:hypothetical protein
MQEQHLRALQGLRAKLESKDKENRMLKMLHRNATTF